MQPVAPELACSDATPQLVHSVDPADGEYVPAAQFTQVDESSCPGCVEYVPEMQLKQALAPTSLWYIPALHAEQAVAEVAEY